MDEVYLLLVFVWSALIIRWVWKISRSEKKESRVTTHLYDDAASKIAYFESLTSIYLDKTSSVESEEHVLPEECDDYTSRLSNAFQIKPNNFSFKTIQSLSRSWDVWEDLEHGEAQLTTEEQLEQYIHSYGKMHEAKLKKGFKRLFKSSDIDLLDGAYELIDYGCGQGVGTVVFIDFLKSYFKAGFKIKSIKLIEPSNLALGRAALNVGYSLRSAKITAVVKTFNEDFDNLTEFELSCDDDTVKIHILSNILDIEDIDLKWFCFVLSETCVGKHYFVCVSPNFHNTTLYYRNANLDYFMQYFEQEHDIDVISERSSNIGKWTRYEKIFKVDFGNNRSCSYSTYPVSLNDEPDDLPF